MEAYTYTYMYNQAVNTEVEDNIKLWSSLKDAAKIRCRATVNYAESKFYSSYMHSISKLFSSLQTTPIFTKNLADIQ